MILFLEESRVPLVFKYPGVESIKKINIDDWFEVGLMLVGKDDLAQGPKLSIAPLVTP